MLKGRLILDTYRVGDRLGAGSMGAVYRAQNVRSRQEVAIKFFTAPDESSWLERFIKEGQLLLEIRHENVVQVHGVHRVGPLPVIVYQLVEGGSLEDLIAREAPLPPRRAAQLTVEALMGLAACHERGVVHRDLKPANILLTKTGRCLIADLGVAKDYSAEGVTLSGQILGTPRYMAPEQMRGEAVAVSTDLFAMGVVLYELLTARVPHEADSLPGLFQALQNEPAPPVTRYAPAVPPALATVVDRSLSKDARVRPQTAIDFAQALRNAVARG